MYYKQFLCVWDVKRNAILTYISVISGLNLIDDNLFKFSVFKYNLSWQFFVKMQFARFFFEIYVKNISKNLHYRGVLPFVMKKKEKKFGGLNLQVS